jgi:hypothetical protein
VTPAHQVTLQLIGPDHPLANNTLSLSSSSTSRSSADTSSTASSSSSSTQGAGQPVGSSTSQSSTSNTQQAVRPPPRRRPGRGGPMGLTPDSLFSDSAAQLSHPGSRVLILRVPASHTSVQSLHSVTPAGAAQPQLKVQTEQNSTGGSGGVTTSSTAAAGAAPAPAPEVIANMVNVRRLLYVRALAPAGVTPG